MPTPRPEATYWAQILIPALAALLGVLIGGLITNYNQKKERQHRRFQDQLGFYAALLGMRMEIRAKSEVRVRLREIGRVEYKNELKEAGDDITQKQKITTERWPEYEKIMQYDEQQLKEELVPLYREMLAYLTKNMALAEPSTLDHYATLVEYVELWNRALKKTLPGPVVLAVEHEEKKLYPLYDNISQQVTRLRKEMRK